MPESGIFSMWIMWILQTREWYKRWKRKCVCVGVFSKTCIKICFLGGIQLLRLHVGGKEVHQNPNVCKPRRTGGSCKCELWPVFFFNWAPGPWTTYNNYQIFFSFIKILILLKRTFLKIIFCAKLQIN